MIEKNHISVRDCRDALGRMAFVYGALVWDKPFLAPLYSFVAQWPLSASLTPPLFVMSVVLWLRDRLRQRRA